jgi:hypothetical protein
MNYNNDTEFLHKNIEEAPGSRVCTKACTPVCQVLLYYYDVSVRVDGNLLPPVTGRE